MAQKEGRLYIIVPKSLSLPEVTAKDVPEAATTSQLQWGLPLDLGPLFSLSLPSALLPSHLSSRFIEGPAVHCSEAGNGHRKMSKMPPFPQTTQGLTQRSRCHGGKQWGKGGDEDANGMFFEPQRRSKSIQGHTEEMGT